jgi:TonB family protein
MRISWMIVAAALVLGSAGEAGAAKGKKYVMVGTGAALHRKPKASSAKLTVRGKQLLRYVARRGAWIEVALPERRGHCGYGGHSRLAMRLFVRTSDVVPAVPKRSRRGFRDGSSARVHLGTPVDSPQLRRLFARRGSRAPFVPPGTLLGTRAAPLERPTLRKTKLVVAGDVEVPVASGVTVKVRQQTTKRLLVQLGVPCVVWTGWMPRADIDMGPRGGQVGGVMGGVLGGMSSGKRTYLRARSKIYWPDGKVAGWARWRHRVPARAKLARVGPLLCHPLRASLAIAPRRLCFRARDLIERTGSVIGGLGAPPPPPPPRTVKPHIVPQVALRSLMIRGQRKIVPGLTTKKKIDRSGKRRIIAVVKMCLGTGGRVSRLQVLKSSGFPAYDRKIERTMKMWRYRPFKVNGKAVPVCTAVTFIYKPGP